MTKKCTPPHPNTDGMHFGGTSGRLLLRCEDRMTLYEQQSRKVLAELQVRRPDKREGEGGEEEREGKGERETRG